MLSRPAPLIPSLRRQMSSRTAAPSKGKVVSEGNAYLLRIAIQQLGVSEHPAYRVVVYGDDWHPRHSDFGNAHTLLETLRSVIPDLDLSKLTMNPLGGGQGSMVFTGEIRLNETQLAHLGLR